MGNCCASYANLDEEQENERRRRESMAMDPNSGKAPFVYESGEIELKMTAVTAANGFNGNSPAFGHSLEDVLANNRHRGRGDNPIPLVVEECIRYLEAHGLDVKGLFARTCDVSALLELKKQYNDRGTVDLAGSAVEKTIQCHLVANLLMSFLRELPHPLMTEELYTNFVEAAEQENISFRVAAVRQLVSTLPQPNFMLLQWVVALMLDVSENHATNEMTNAALAKIFAMLILAPNSASRDKEPDRRAVEIVKTIMDHYGEIFDE